MRTSSLSRVTAPRFNSARAAWRRPVLEALESRALLSVTIAAGGKSASFTDVDGDLVTVAVSRSSGEDLPVWVDAHVIIQVEYLSDHPMNSWVAAAAMSVAHEVVSSMNAASLPKRA